MPIRLVFSVALITTTVLEQHPRPHHKGIASVDMQPALVLQYGNVGFKQETDCIQFYVFANPGDLARHLKR